MDDFELIDLKVTSQTRCCFLPSTTTQYEECSKKNGLRTVNRDPIFTGRLYRRSVLPHHSSASRFTVGAAEQRDEREHIQPQQEARYEGRCVGGQDPRYPTG